MLSRRAFVQAVGAAGAVAAAPVTSRLAAAHGARAEHVVVVGAGAFGGWTALNLLRQGAAVTLVDAWGPGNARASSGGETRVIRARLTATSTAEVGSSGVDGAVASRG